MVSLAAQLARSKGAEITVGIAEANVGEDAVEVGLREIRQTMRDAGIKKMDNLRTMVFVGSLLFIVGQIATDLSYGIVDPRVRFE